MIAIHSLMITYQYSCIRFNASVNKFNFKSCSQNENVRHQRVKYNAIRDIDATGMNYRNHILMLSRFAYTYIQFSLQFSR